MRRGIAAAVMAGLLGGVAAARAAEPAAGLGRLGWDLVRASGPGNAIVSPVSVWEALAMTHAGARGKTAAEMAVVLGMPDDRAAVAAAAATIRKSFAAATGDKIILDVANRIWVQRGKPLAAEFTALLAGAYGAAAGIVDFAGAPEPARAEINAWVSDHTAKKIDELMQAGTIDAMTRLVLTNAVYLKAPWAEKFPQDATRPEPFHLAAGGTAVVPFMHRSGSFVAKVVHEGFVEVAEEGTEAAAATGVAIAVRSAVVRDEPLVIRADRPFAWAVIDRVTNAMLFAGIVADPR